MTETRLYRSPLGDILLAAENNSITGCWFVGQKHFPAHLPAANSDSPVLLQAEHWLDVYFSGQDPDFLPPLAPKGTVFQLRVWSELSKIPYGMTVTYGQLLPGNARAVGNAVGRNPISLFIPCHRVVGQNGSLTGYAGGLERKQFLLKLEQSQP